MIKLDSSKYKPHNPTEDVWLTKTHEIISMAIIENSLPYDYIRIGRQSKSWGSSGVSSYKTELTNDGVGVWINGKYDDSLDLNKVIKHMAKSTVNWKHIKAKTTDEQKCFLKLKFDV